VIGLVFDPSHFLAREVEQLNRRALSCGFCVEGDRTTVRREGRMIRRLDLLLLLLLCAPFLAAFLPPARFLQMRLQRVNSTARQVHERERPLVVFGGRGDKAIPLR
jgi:hypothetical protein